ncbi:MAG: nuclear transport factor 2 family protein [Acidimicrobiales bacterium]
MSTRGELAYINEAFSKAVAEQDLEAIVKFHTENACVLPANAPLVRGLSEIEAFTKAGLSEGPQTIEFTTGDILESGSLIVDVGAYVKRVGRPLPSTDTGKYVAVYERQADGSLLLAVDMFSSDEAP